MADTFTQNLVLTKTGIGESEDTWGTKTNQNWQVVSELFQSGPALKVANGGTGATTASLARTNLGLGTMATQNADTVAITGGTASLSQVTVTSPVARVLWAENDAPANNGNWGILADGATLQFRTYGDDLIAANNFLTVSRSGSTVGNVDISGTTLRFNGNTVCHQANLATFSINEGQLVDGTIFPRLASTETVTGVWSFTGIPQKTGGGKFLHYASSSFSGGEITVSTGAATGVPSGEGAIWIQY